MPWFDDQGWKEIDRDAQITISLSLSKEGASISSTRLSVEAG
jgi:hypothetical protein